ncbi:MAG: hypothetical protein BWZ11_00031 [Bacteroidetes bacterium ADurb.BinA395]|nr:MAG: hypothetical protein BWZ11_00031 [Bacteroidetes bacterium ADurb.BinA395]
MEPTCLNIIFIRFCVCNTCGFHIMSYALNEIKLHSTINVTNENYKGNNSQKRIYIVL